MLQGKKSMGEWEVALAQWAKMAAFHDVRKYGNQRTTVVPIGLCITSLQPLFKMKEVAVSINGSWLQLAGREGLTHLPLFLC